MEKLEITTHEEHTFVPAQGDMEKITAMTNYLIHALDLWLSEHGKENSVDVFMAAHNFHKQIVSTIAKQWEDTGQKKQYTFRLADMTFRRAMKEEWRRT